MIARPMRTNPQKQDTAVTSGARESALDALRQPARAAVLIFVAAGVVLVALVVAFVVGRDGGQGSADPGPRHVHALGVNPRDDALFLASHTGLYRIGRGETSARRVSDRYQDTMGFTVV